MIYTSLSDNELRLAIDNAPHDIAVRDEVVKRYLAQRDTPEQEALDEAFRQGHDKGYDEAYDALR